MKFSFDNKEYDIYWTEDLNSLLEFFDEGTALQITRNFSNDFFIKDKVKLIFLKAQKIVFLDKDEISWLSQKPHLGKTQRSLPYLTEEQIYQVDKAFRKKAGIKTFIFLLNAFIVLCKVSLLIFILWCFWKSSTHWHIYTGLTFILFLDLLNTLNKSVVIL